MTSYPEGPTGAQKKVLNAAAKKRRKAGGAAVKKTAAGATKKPAQAPAKESNPGNWIFIKMLYLPIRIYIATFLVMLIAFAN